MAKVFLAIINQRLTVILGGLGFVIAVASFYELSGAISDLTVRPLGIPNFYQLGLGGLAIAISVLLAFFPDGLQGHRFSQNVQNVGDGLKIEFGRTSVFIHFGLLQDYVDNNDPKSAVVLPSNDLFDDHCFDDKKIAMGGYLSSYFSSKEIEELKNQRDVELANLPSTDIEDGFAPGDQSYGIGSSIYLEKSGHRMIIAAVSTKRKVDGVKSEISYLHRAMREVLIAVSENELNTVSIPVLGSGKGGIPDQIAFLSLLNAVFECARRTSGHHLSAVHIVIYKASNDSEPQITPSEVRRILLTVIALWE